MAEINIGKSARNLGFSARELAEAKAYVAPDEITADSNPNYVPPVQEQTFEAAQVHELAKNDLDFLAAMAVPTIFQYCFPPVFLSVWQWLLTYVHKKRDFSKLALGLPRGFGKTTLVKIFCLYCILFTERKFILVISETATKANNIISDIVDMLDEPNIKRVFGDWRLGIEKDTQEIKKFGFRGRNIILAGLGVNGSLRGMNLKNERPDIMIFEDIQSSEDADSDVVSDKIEKWMLGTAMKAKSPSGCLYIFVGNMYPTKWSLLRRLKSNPNWVKFIAGGILSDGTSLWEELQPIEQLLQEFQVDMDAGRPEIFYSEVLNDENAAVNNKVDFSKLPAYPFEDDDISAGNFIIIDPSNDKKDSDAVSIGYCEIHNAYPVMREVVEGRFSPGDTIRESIKLCLKYNCRLVAVESNGFQYSLLYWSRLICEQTGILGIEFVPVYSGTYSKNSRILSMFQSYQAGHFYVHPDCRTPIHIQIMSFNVLKRDNTDGLLDLLTYMTKVIEEFGEFIVSNQVIEMQEFSDIPVLENNSSF